MLCSYIQIHLPYCTYSIAGLQLSLIQRKDARGNITSTYSPHNGWHAIGTREEHLRESEFNAIYTEAWRSFKAASQNNQSHISTSSGSIDVSV